MPTPLRREIAQARMEQLGAYRPGGADIDGKQWLQLDGACSGVTRRGIERIILTDGYSHPCFHMGRSFIILDTVEAFGAALVLMRFDVENT